MIRGIIFFPSSFCYHVSLSLGSLAQLRNGHGLYRLNKCLYVVSDANATFVEPRFLTTTTATVGWLLQNKCI